MGLRCILAASETGSLSSSVADYNDNDDDDDIFDVSILLQFIGTSGIWYEIRKSGNQPDDCSRLEFGTGTTTVSLSNPSVVNNFAQTATGTATHTTGTATLTLTLTSSTNRKSTCLSSQTSLT